MKLVKKISVLLLLVFVGIQFIPAKHNESTLIPISDFMKVYKVPTHIEKKVKAACYDCHSNHTEYPWYSKVQPFAWILEGHIKEGKKELNFSDFGNYSSRRQKNKLKSIGSQIKEDKMPFYSYTLMHREAKLSKKEKNELEKWFLNLRDSL